MPAPDIDYRAVERLLDLVAVFDADGRIVDASPSHEHVLGYEPDELIGTNALELVHESDREAVRAAFAAPGGTAAGVQTGCARRTWP